MDLTALRREIDSIDDELIQLFVKRMDVCAQVADYKKKNNLPILMPARELEKLEDVARKAGPEMADYAKQLYALLFQIWDKAEDRRNRERDYKQMKKDFQEFLGAKSVDEPISGDASPPRSMPILAIIPTACFKKNRKKSNRS